MARRDNQDLEKTQYLSLQGQRKLEDTQSLPPVSEDMGEIQPPFPKAGERTLGRSEGVRELESEICPPPRRERQEKSKGLLSSGGKKFLLLLAGFLLALTLGFALAGWSQDKSAEKEQARQQQEAQLLSREQKLQQQEADLKEERERLARQKQVLEERRQEVAEKSAHLQGKNDQLTEENQKPGLGRLLDRMTGKEKERKEALEENKRQSAQLDDEAASVKQSIAQAQAMLEDLDQRIDDVQAMKQEAEGLRSKVQSAYEENRGTVDQVIYYVQQGADMLQKLLGDKQINK